LSQWLHYRRAVNGIDGCVMDSTAGTIEPSNDHRLNRQMIEVREFASTVMQRLQLVRSAEGLHPKLVDGKVHERICYKFGGGAKPRSTAE